MLSLKICLKNNFGFFFPILCLTGMFATGPTFSLCVQGKANPWGNEAQKGIYHPEFQFIYTTLMLLRSRNPESRISCETRNCPFLLGAAWLEPSAIIRMWNNHVEWWNREDREVSCLEKKSLCFQLSPFAPHKWDNLVLHLEPLGNWGGFDFQD